MAVLIFVLDQSLKKRDQDHFSVAWGRTSLASPPQGTVKTVCTCFSGSAVSMLSILSISLPRAALLNKVLDLCCNLCVNDTDPLVYSLVIKHKVSL